MSNAEKQYFALLRAALWNTPIAIDGPIDWNTVMAVANHHGNNVLIMDVATRMLDADQLPPELTVSMRAAMRNGLIHQMRLRQIMVSAVTLLRDNGIEPVLLKGFGLASLYPNPSLRQFGDIDIYVGLEEYHEACKLLRNLPGGYNWGEEPDSGKHFNIEFGQYPMEIHRVSADVTEPKESEIYAAIERDGLLEHPQRVELDGFEVSLPSKEFVVFFTFFHAWHHYLTTGVGWRQLSDVALALHAYHGQLDLDKLRQWLNDMRVMKPWQTFGCLLVDYLGLSEEEMPFFDASRRRTSQRLFNYIMEDGNFRRDSQFKRRNPKSRFMHKVHAFLVIFVEFFRRVKVFPSVAFREMFVSLRKAFGKMGGSSTE